MCRICDLKHTPVLPRFAAGQTASDRSPGSFMTEEGQPFQRGLTSRRSLLTGAVAAALAPTAAFAQVDVGKASAIRKLVPAETLERSALQQYRQMMGEAGQKGALAGSNDPQLRVLQSIAKRLIPFAAPWNDRSRQWQWEVNLIRSPQLNAFCMPGGKITFYTGILDQLKLSADEAAMIMGHEMAHALREHARERIAKSKATGLGLSIGAQLLGFGQLGDMAASLGTQLLTLKFSREDESEADLVGLELAARGAFVPSASVSLWQKMSEASGGGNGSSFFSTHPSGPERIRELDANVPRVKALYEQALAARGAAK
jgi:Zn-dependent protease with chaperone function